MPADKIDVRRLAREANGYASAYYQYHAWQSTGLKESKRIRDEYFARLVMEECAKMADERRHLHLLLNELGEAIRARMP